MILRSLKQLFRQKPYIREVPSNRIKDLRISVGLLVFLGCGGTELAEKSAPKSAQRVKPEGLLIITRELDLGTLPLGGTLEATLALKNPSKTESIDVESYEISRPGIDVEPKQMTIAPQATKPIQFKILREATQTPGEQRWDVTALVNQQQVVFRTTLKLKVEPGKSK